MKYSITIPAYKATFFRDCLESVLSQTFDDYEVVILNDCSPENIKGIVEEFCSHKNAEKIRYYENEKNVGSIDVVDNWNKLLNLSEGDYIICMGDDDMLAPNCLEEYDKLIDKYPNLDVYHGRTEIIDEHSNFINLQEDRPDFESVYSMIWHIYFKNRCQYIGDFLFKTASLRERGGFCYSEYAFGADWLTSFMMSQTHGIANTHIPIFKYRDNSRTISHHTTGVKRMDSEMRYIEWMNDFLTKEPQNDIDKKLWKLIVNHQHIKDEKSKINTIRFTLDECFFKNTLYWLNNKTKYKLTNILIFRGMLLSLVDKLRNKNL